MKPSSSSAANGEDESRHHFESAKDGRSLKATRASGRMRTIASQKKSPGRAGAF
jgi:hypothetical protein